MTINSCTIYDSAKSRDVIRCDDASSSVSASINTTISQCTFHNVGSGEASYRFFYTRFSGNTNVFTNNVVSGFCNKRGFGNSSSISLVQDNFKNNYYYNCQNLTSAGSSADSTITFYDENGTVLEDDPFADADNADFTITDELLQSYEFGDPRWY